MEKQSAPVKDNTILCPTIWSLSKNLLVGFAYCPKKISKEGLEGVFYNGKRRLKPLYLSLKYHFFFLENFSYYFPFSWGECYNLMYNLLCVSSVHVAVYDNNIIALHVPDALEFVKLFLHILSHIIYQLYDRGIISLKFINIFHQWWKGG